MRVFGYPLAQVLGSAGFGAGAGGSAANIVYLLRDEFTTALVAGAVNGTLSEPSGHTRTVVDTTSKLSISAANGLEIASPVVAAGDAAIWYPTITRAIGLAVGWRMKVNSGSPTHVFGVDNDQSGLGRDGVFLGSALRAFFNQAQRDMLTTAYSAGVTYDSLTILRNPGVWVLIRGGVFTDWTLGFTINVATYNVFPAITPNTGGGASIYVRRVYAAQLAQWATQYANASERKAVSVNGDTITASAGDALIEHTIVAATGVTQELMVRRTDDDNCLIIRMDFTAATIRVYEKVAGVETEKTGGTTTMTWVNATAYRIFVSLYGSAVRVTVATTPKNDATSSYNGSVTGVKVSHAGTDLIAWPVAITGAAKAELDAFFPL